MSYISLTFAAFVLVLLLVYYLVPKKARGLILLAGSLVFYACFDLRYLVFLLFVAASTYLGARLIAESKHKKTILGITVGANALLWFVIKELPWTMTLINDIFTGKGTETIVPEFTLLVPVGISYYIIQAIGYLADTYKGKISPDKSFWKYLLFLSYFPAIVQGPISRYDKLMPQLLNKEKFSFDKFRNGFVLVLFGLVKKMVIADRLGIFVNTVFGNYSDYGATLLYLGAVGYALQLFMDFSGCVDLCRGVSTMFSIELINNFNRPYHALSIKEFWGKWHISFSSWLKDYIYIPLGGNRKGTLRKYLNILITFMVSGIWHGAGFQFLFWGALHAVYQIVGQATLSLRSKFKKLIGVKEGSFSEKFYQWLITFNLVTFAWIFFRSSTLSDAFGYIFNMLSRPDFWVLFDGSMFELGVSKNAFIVILLHVIALVILEFLSKKQEDVIGMVTRQHIILRWAIYIALVFDVLLLGVYGSGYDVSSFMYGGF